VVSARRERAVPAPHSVKENNAEKLIPTAEKSAKKQRASVSLAVPLQAAKAAAMASTSAERATVIRRGAGKMALRVAFARQGRT